MSPGAISGIGTKASANFWWKRGSSSCDRPGTAPQKSAAATSDRNGRMSTYAVASLSSGRSCWQRHRQYQTPQRISTKHCQHKHVCQWKCTHPQSSLIRTRADVGHRHPSLECSEDGAASVWNVALVQRVVGFRARLGIPEVGIFPMSAMECKQKRSTASGSLRVTARSFRTDDIKGDKRTRRKSPETRGGSWCPRIVQWIYTPQTE